MMKRFGPLAVVLMAGTMVACDRYDRDETRTGTYDEQPGAIGTRGEAVTAGDKDFVEKALVAGMAEVELGRMAQTKASSAEVKQFAEMMEKDHSKAGDELKEIANQHGITPPMQLDDKHRDLKDRLSKLQGAEFDRDYMNAMVQGHEDMVDLLENRAGDTRLGSTDPTMRGEPHTGERHGERTGAATPSTGTTGMQRDDAHIGDRYGEPKGTMTSGEGSVDTSLDRWASNTLPTTRHHLDEAKRIHDKVTNRTNQTR